MFHGRYISLDAKNVNGFGTNRSQVMAIYNSILPVTMTSHELQGVWNNQQGDWPLRFLCTKLWKD